MNLTVRRLQPEDVPILVEIEKECFPDPTWNAGDFANYRTVVAELEARVVGFLVVVDVFPGHGSDAAECEILNLAVTPVARGLGVATALMQHITRPATRYFLEVRESNTAARKLYKKLGFVEIGSRPNYYDNPPETAIVMAKK